MPTFRVIGPGRAGRSFAGALAAAGWNDAGARGRGDDIESAAAGVDVVLITTPDAAIASTAAAIAPVESTAVVHAAGSLGSGVLAPHTRRAVVHPLLSLPNADIGAARLRSGAWFSTTGDSIGSTIVDALGGRAVAVSDEHRVAYHAAACIAGNHVVAVLAQAERVARATGVPLAAYLDLVRGVVDNVDTLGAVAALTGPAARGDDVTVARHTAAIASEERPLYEALAAECRRLGQWK